MTGSHDGRIEVAVTRLSDEHYGLASQAEFVEQDRYDAAVLRARGVRFAEWGIFEMFPHPVHVEILSLSVRIR